MTHNVGIVQTDIDSTCIERIVVQGATEMHCRRSDPDRQLQYAWYLLDVKINRVGLKNSGNNGFTL